MGAGGPFADVTEEAFCLKSAPALDQPIAVK